MKKVFALFCLLSTLNINAQIKVTNNSKSPISICVGYYKSTSNYKGFITEGWWKIIPGETAAISGYDVHNGDNTFYYYAYNETGKWTGEYQLAVASEKFEIINADKDYVLKNNSKYRKEGFRQKTFHIGLLDPLSYNLSLD